LSSQRSGFEPPQTLAKDWPDAAEKLAAGGAEAGCVPTPHLLFYVVNRGGGAGAVPKGAPA